MPHKEERRMNGTGRIALVTGAGTGIGKRTALLLLEAGYSVVLVGRRIEPLEHFFFSLIRILRAAYSAFHFLSSEWIKPS